ncbi:MAG: ROK family protein [Chloroflexota bacterium]
MQILGIDIGGSGIKGALVDVHVGELITERHRIPTPQPAEPEAVAAVVAQIVAHFDYDGPIGITFPAVVKGGVTLSAANVDDAWIGIDAEGLFAEKTGKQVIVLNDADAAGIAEFTYGAGKNHGGTIIVLTFGTGIGSAIFVNGRLIPNTEFGHMELKGMDAEHYAADSARKREDLSWKKWGKRVSKFLDRMDTLFSPDLYIIGGGVSKKEEKFFHRLKTDTPVVAAAMRNEAGIIGAALAAADLLTEARTPSVLEEHVIQQLTQADADDDGSDNDVESKSA